MSSLSYYCGREVGQPVTLRIDMEWHAYTTALGTHREVNKRLKHWKCLKTP